MKTRSTVVMALAMGLTMVGTAAAAPRPVFGRPASTSKVTAKTIRPVRTSSQFKGRQTRKFVPTKIVIPPMQFSGGQNLAAAKASVEKALADVKKEVVDQKRLMSGNKNRIGRLDKNIRKYTVLKKGYEVERDAIQAEIDILEAISNPSSAIQTCLNELKTDRSAVVAQIHNTVKTIKEYQARRKFAHKIGIEAKGNLKRLNTAVTHLTNAKRSLSMVKRPAPKPSWKNPMNFFK